MIPQEWSGENFLLRFGDDCELSFEHTPIKMSRNSSNVLEGEFDVTNM